MQVFIPSIGSKLKLERDWNPEISTYYESRLLDSLVPESKGIAVKKYSEVRDEWFWGLEGDVDYSSAPDIAKILVPKGTIVILENHWKISIPKSVFQGPKAKGYKNLWFNIREINKIVCSVIEE